MQSRAEPGRGLQNLLRGSRRRLSLSAATCAVWIGLIAGIPATLVAQPAVPAKEQPTAAAAQAATDPAATTGDSAASFAIRGRLVLTSGGRPLRSEEAVDAVVYFRPSRPVPVQPPAIPYVIATERKTFSPRVLPIPVGSSVRFPNNDPILHNVFSTAREAPFDLGLYGRGDGESQQFNQAGVIRVFCNVHHSMVAHVLVMDTPFFVKPDAQGRFRLRGIPAGPGELLVWHERAQLWRQALAQAPDAEVVVPLELSKRKVPPHLNKHGQPYRRARPDEY